MDVRPFDRSLVGPALEFFRTIPEGDRTFFKEDVLDEAAVSGWADDQRNRRLLAVEDDGRVVGYVAVIPGVGWSSHVGDLRLVISPDRRRQGLGRDLARRGLTAALGLGLHKLVVEVVADQTAAVEMFQRLGFDGEALLRNHVCDREGHLRDLIMLAHDVDENWELMATTGITEAVGEPA
jgi:ribosomal protein S18 acetylase RimI-like enzyme